MLDRREYEERYGEHVGMCKIHGTVLGSCEICEGEPEWLSECCSAPPIEIQTLPILLLLLLSTVVGG